MKVKLSIIQILCLSLMSINHSFGQNGLDKFINSLSNDSLRFEVMKVGTAELKKGNTIALPKTLVAVQSVDVNRLVAKYKKKLLVKRLFSVLGDTSKDWYANVLLYAITERDATPLVAIEGREDWLNSNKSKDIEYWSTYLK
jgi:hypothetical protein